MHAFIYWATLYINTFNTVCTKDSLNLIIRYHLPHTRPTVHSHGPAVCMDLTPLYTNTHLNELGQRGPAHFHVELVMVYLSTVTMVQWTQAAGLSGFSCGREEGEIGTVT